MPEPYGALVFSTPFSAGRENMTLFLSKVVNCFEFFKNTRKTYNVSVGFWGDVGIPPQCRSRALCILVSRCTELNACWIGLRSGKLRLPSIRGRKCVGSNHLDSHCYINAHQMSDLKILRRACGSSIGEKGKPSLTQIYEVVVTPIICQKQYSALVNWHPKPLDVF